MISVFVSSTFRDMQGERDVIQKKVLPEIRSFCIDRGENISFVDLRWGVDTSRLRDDEEKSKKVLNVCLDQIDRCKPYIIVLLGQRYGWVPDYSLIRNAVASKQYTDDGSEKSVTALEIEYGALSGRDHADKYIFFFREDLPLDKMPASLRSDFGTESAFHAARLKELKEKIKEAFPNRVFTYSLKWDGNRLTGFEEFCEMVTESLKSMIGSAIREEQALTEAARDLRPHLRLIEERHFSFAERKKLLRGITDSIKENRLIILPGAPGTGKTSIAAELAWNLRSDDCAVIPVICGHTSDSSTAFDILNLVLANLEELCGYAQDRESMDSGQLKGYLAGLIDKYCMNGRRLIIILDGLDCLAADDISMHLNFLPPRIHECCSIIVTCRDTYQLPEHFAYKTILHRIPNAEVGEMVGMISHLMKIQAKELDAKSRLALTTEKKSGTNPLYLSLMLRRIINLDSEDFRGIAERGNDMSAISGYITDLIRQSPDSIDGAVFRLCTEVIQNIAPDQTEKVLRLTALTARGFGQEHLQELFARQGWKWSELEFARMQKYLYGFVTERERGRFDYAYPEMREMILSGLGREGKRNLCALLVDYIKDLPDDDYLKQFDLFHLACEADDKKTVVDYLNRMGRSDNSGAAQLLARNMSLCIADGNDEWFNALLSRGNALGAEYSMVDYLAGYLIPDMRSSNASDAAMLNIGGLIAENTVRLARALRQAAAAQGNRFGRVMRVTAENAESRFKELGETIGNYEKTGFALGRALKAAAGYCELLYDYDTALRYSFEALSYYQALHDLYRNDSSRRSLAVLMNSTGRLSLRFGACDAAIRLGREIISLCNDTENRIDAQELLGKAYAMKGNQQEALEYYSGMTEECSAYSEGKTNPGIFRKLSAGYEAYAMLLLSAGDYPGAGKALERSAKIISCLAPNHDYYERIRLSAVNLQHTGTLLCAAGHYQKAASNIEMSIKWFREIQSRYDTPDHRHNLAEAYAALARVMAAAGEYIQADSCYETAGEMLENLAEEYKNSALIHENLMQAYKEMGDCKVRQGLASDAEPYYEECAVIKDRLRTIAASTEETIQKWIT